MGASWFFVWKNQNLYAKLDIYINSSSRNILLDREGDCK